MNEEEKIREEIARKIYTDWCKYNDEDNLTWEDLPKYRKATYLEWVTEYILSLKGIRIECSNQDLPDQSHFLNYASPAGKCYQLAQKDMLKAGFVKCRRKEEHGS